MGTATVLAELTDKQKLWFHCYTDETNSLTFLNGTQSALVAYNTDSDNSARQIGHENLRKLAPHIDSWMEEYGFSERALKRKVKQLMSAKETKFHKLKGAVSQDELEPGQRVVCTSGRVHWDEDENGEETMKYGEGDTLIAIDVENKELQRRTTDMAIKMKGLYAADKLELSGLEKLGERLTKANARVAGESAESTEGDDLFD